MIGVSWAYDRDGLFADVTKQIDEALQAGLPHFDSPPAIEMLGPWGFETGGSPAWWMAACLTPTSFGNPASPRDVIAATNPHLIGFMRDSTATVRLSRGDGWVHVIKLGPIFARTLRAKIGADGDQSVIEIQFSVPTREVLSVGTGPREDLVRGVAEKMASEFWAHTEKEALG